MQKLTELRPHFYPFACKQTLKEENGRRRFIMDEISPHPLPKADLLKLYASTHKHVHRGSLKALLSSVEPIAMAVNFPEILTWAKRINTMLSLHTIAINEKKLIICILRNSDDNDRVQVAITEKPSEP